MSALSDLQSLIAERGVDGALAATAEWPAALRDPAVVRLVERSAAILARDPGQLASQLAGRCSDDQAGLRRELAAATGPGLRLVSPSLEPPGSPSVGSVAVHRRLVHALVVLPDGDTCVTASEDGGRLGLVSLSTVDIVGWLLGHQGPVNHLAVDPATGLVVSAGDDHTVRVWQVASGRQVHVLYGHEHYVRQVAVAAGRIVSASQDGTVRVWDLDSGACRHVLRDHAAGVMAVAISADGRVAASSSMDNSVLVWDLDTGRLTFPLYDTRSSLMRFDALGGTYMSVPGPGGDPARHRECPTWLWLSPDGRRLASAQREVIWWELATGRELARIANQGSFLQSAAVSPDGRQIAVAGLAGVQLWSLDGPVPTPRASLTGDHTWSVGYTPDGRTLVTGDDAGRVHVWRPRVDPAWASRPVHPARISHLATSPDGRRAASIDDGGTIHLWDLDAGRLLGRARHASARGTAAGGEACAFTADGQSLVSAGSDDVVRWDAQTGAELRRVPFDDGGLLPSALAVLPGDRAVLVGHLGAGLVRCGLSTRTSTRLAGDIARTETIRVGPDGSWALTLGHASVDGQERRALHCWNLQADRLQWMVVADGSWPVGDGPSLGFVALAPDGRHAVTGSPSDAGRVARWELFTGARLAELDLPGYVIDAQWGPDELRLATPDGVHWVAADLSAIRRTLPLGDVHTLALVAGGRFVVVRPEGAPCDIALIDLTDGAERGRFLGESPIHGLTVAADGDTVLATDAQRRVHILRISSRL